MTEREDTIERIERVLSLTHKESITVTIPRLTAERAVSMLKEQEPVKPIKKGMDKFCGKCKKGIVYYFGGGNVALFCPACGQEVDWDE